MQGVILTSEKKIPTIGGEVSHIIKNNSNGYNNFGEAYFTEIEPRIIRAWKCHTKMISNIVVPIGKIKFVIFDNRRNSETHGDFFEVNLSKENYQRLTIPPNVWFGFQCLDKKSSLIINIASISHNSEEILRKDLTEIDYHWD